MPHLRLLSVVKPSHPCKQRKDAARGESENGVAFLIRGGSQSMLLVVRQDLLLGDYSSQLEYDTG